MKSAVYTLTNEEFAYFANKVDESLREREIPHVLVGGIATQAHILDRMCKTHGKDVNRLSLDESLRLQDYLRATDAIDFALKFSEYESPSDVEEAHKSTGKKINEFCASLSGEDFSGTGDHIFNYGVSRTGIQKPVFTVSVDGEPKSEIYLKLSRRPEDLDGLAESFYNPFVEEGVDLEIPYSGDYSLKLRVLKPEHLLAVKIALDRGKDAMDVKNLVYVMREAGELEGKKEKRLVGTLRKILVPGYEKQLQAFGSAVGIDIKIPYQEKQDKNTREINDKQLHPE